ncbi:putative Ig domain-containing protein [candidate division KSB1 bacterium]
MQKTDFSKRSVLFAVVLILICLAPAAGSAQVDIWKLKGPPAPADTILSLAIHPGFPDSIFAGGDSSKVYFTPDSGLTWITQTTLPGVYDVVRLFIHPNNDSLIAATDNGGVFISPDLGSNWTQKNTGMADTALIDLIFNPLSPDTLFAIGKSGGVMKSISRGNSWFSRNDGLADSVNVSAIVHAANDPTMIYVGTSTGKIYQSINYGWYWTLRGTIAGASISALVVDTDDPDILYAGTVNNGAHSSNDAGATWSQIPVNDFSDDLKVLSMEFDNSSTKKLYAGTDGNGVFQYVIGAAAFNAINLGLNNGVINDLELNPQEPYIIFAGTQLQGVYKYTGNRFPSIAPALNDVQANAGIPFSFTVIATDPDAFDILKYTVEGLPSGATYDSLATRIFRWTPTVADVGDHEVIFKVHDQRGGADRDTVNINVNRIPVISIADTSIVSFEDSTITFTVSGSDPDGDNLIYTVSSLPAGAIYDTSSTPTFTWTPTVNQAGNYTLVFSVNDGRTGIASQSVHITVVNTNQPPVFNPALTDRTVQESQTLAFTIGGTDPDGDALSYGTFGSLPSGAGFDSTNTMRFSWVPTYDDSGSYSVAFSLNDGQATTIDSITISVLNVNRNPLFSSFVDTLYVNEGNNLSFSFNAVDPDSDAVTYNVANLPTGATFDFTTGEFAWIPTYNQSGSYRIVFNALDDQGGASYMEVYVIVNQPPVWSPVAGQLTQEGVTLSFSIIANDADGDSVAYTVDNQPENAVVTISDSVRFLWIPQDGQTGMYAVTFTADDGRGGISEVIVPIQVTSSTGQLPPTIITTSDKTVSENQLVIFQVVATDDSPQDSLIFGFDGTLPTGAAFDSDDTHIFQWVPSYSQSGNYLLIFTVTDNFANVSSDTVEITVVNLNRIPTTALPDDTMFVEGESISLPLNIVDPDGDPMVIEYFEVPFGGYIDSTGVHTFVWDPTYLQEGEFHLRFRAVDSFGGRLMHDITITIGNSNRIPADFDIVFPTQGEEVQLTEYIIWQKSQDPDLDDTVSYSLEIDDDPDFGSVDITVGKINNNEISISPSAFDDQLSFKISGTSSSGDAFVLLVNEIPGIMDLTDDGLYYWRVRSFDNRGGESGYTAGTNSLHINLENDAPLPPSTGLSPDNGGSVGEQLPVFSWDHAEDPDYSDTEDILRYVLELSDNNFISGYDYRVVTQAGENSVQSPVVFNDNEVWYYRLKTFDDDGDSSVYTEAKLFYANLINDPPDDFGLIFPDNNFDFASRPDSILFDWDDSFDPDPGNNFVYRLELSVNIDFAAENIIVYIDSIPNTQSEFRLASNILEKEFYFWRVLATDERGVMTPSSEIRIFGLITDVYDDFDGIVPRRFEVKQNYPNPFNNQTIVRYSLPKYADVRIAIYSSLGQLVYEEYRPGSPRGFHIFQWNGRSLSGMSVASGMYLLTVTAENEISAVKLLLLK